MYLESDGAVLFQKVFNKNFFKTPKETKLLWYKGEREL